ncbi:MAG TPA: M20/M25/M40 family metallo-hydrolase [Clostridia bacterium]|nr:M20/M25/M40 family metallo-hydrolase [Clostridia bacterium]
MKVTKELLDRAMTEDLKKEIIDMTADMVNIPSPTGEELAMAKYVAQRYEELGLEVQLQEVEPERYNVIARLKGSGGGKSLMLNGHFDTSTTGKENLKELGIGHRPKAVIKDGWMYGLGVSNMKCAFSAYYGTVKLLQEVKPDLKGDVVITGVVGEIEKAPVDEYQGRIYRGGGCGAISLMQHGIVTDMCIDAEPTGLRLQPYNCGFIFARITTKGVAMHTWCKEFGVDAIDKMLVVIEEVKKWGQEFEAKNPHPRMKPRVGIGAIRGGYPFKPSICPSPFCNLYIDIRMLPQQSIIDVKNELKAVIRRLGERYDELADTEVSFYIARPGYEEPEGSEICRVMERAHKEVFGQDVDYPVGYRSAVSSDTMIFHHYGIPSVTYGPGGIQRNGVYSMYDGHHGECLGLDNLIQSCKVYALAAVDICNTPA